VGEGEPVTETINGTAVATTLAIGGAPEELEEIRKILNRDAGRGTLRVREIVLMRLPHNPGVSKAKAEMNEE
jgi:hypothetical protein